MDVSLLADIALIIIVASIFAGLVKLFRQPLILGYVLGGVIIGPAVLGLVQNKDLITTLSELGIAFLLFIIGLELDLKKLKEVGVSAIFVGFLQVLFTTIAGFAIAYLLGFGIIESAIIGIIISFSSTMIVIKLLSDKNELDSLHGKMMLGILIMQDILAVLALSLVTTLNNLSISVFGMIILKGLALVAVAYILVRFILPGIFKFFETSTELLFIGALTICFILSGIAYYLGYSFAIGAFIAGVALTYTQYNIEIASRIRPLRDFFAVIFFVTLGMTVVLKGIGGILLPLIALLVAVLVIKPLITFSIMKMFRYGRRTSVITGSDLGQVSEFSLILASIALTNGLVSEATVTITTLLMVITATLTAYIINFDEKIYQLLNRIFGRDKAEAKGELTNLPDKELKDHIIVFGTHRMGMKVITHMHRERKNFVVVDFNPERVKQLIKKKVHCVYGDMNNSDLYEQLNFKKAGMVVSTVHNYEVNAMLIKKVRETNKKAVVIVATRITNEALKLYDEGADYVIFPESLGGEKIINYMKHLTPKGIKEWGKKHHKSLIEEEKDQLVRI